MHQQINPLQKKRVYHNAYNQNGNNYNDNNHQTNQFQQPEDSNKTYQPDPTNAYQQPNSSNGKNHEIISQKSITSQDQKIDYNKEALKKKTNSFPRPIINTVKTSDPEYHSASYNFDNPPPSYFRTICEDEGNSTCRFIRPTCYKILDDPNVMSKKKIPLGVVITPLAEASYQEQPVPQVDYTNRTIPRCARCHSFINPSFVPMEGMSKFKCNFCNLDNTMTTEFRRSWEDQENAPELSKGVYDIIVPQEYHLNEMIKPNVLICIEMTSKSILSGVFHSILSNVQSSIEGIDYALKIGIITYDTNVSFYSVPEDVNDQISIVRMCDPEDAFSALGIDDLLLSIHDENDKAKLDRLFEGLFSIADMQYETYSNQKVDQKPVIGTT